MSTSVSSSFNSNPKSLFSQEKPLSDIVQSHLTLAKSSELSNQEGLVIDAGYDIHSLSKPDLISLYTALRKEETSAKTPQEKRILQILLFDITDIILREISLDPHAAEFYQKSLPKEDSLLKKIDTFHKTGGTAFNLNGPSSDKLLPNRKIRTLTCTLETERAVCGGVGAVVRGLNKAMRELNALKAENNYPNRATIHSLIPLYEKDKSEELKEAHFLGTITHKYNNQDVVSSVYKNPKTGEYLVQPDPRFARLFNIPLENGVYGTNKTSDCYQRGCYIGSAFAATCLQYTGSKGNDRIDVAQADFFWGGTIGFPLIEQNRKKDSVTPRTVLIMHHGVLKDKWYIDEKSMHDCGIHSHPGKHDAMSIAMRIAEKVVFVSSQIASMALSKDPTISAGRNADLTPEKVLSINNGVDGKRFDPSNKEVFKELSLERTFDAAGNETTDFVAYRQKIIQMLFDGGVVADPTLPLVANIGRFDYYKGTDMMRYALDHPTLPANAQFIVVGAGDGLKEHVDRLKELAETTHKKQLRVVDTIERQKQTLVVNGKDTGVRIGDLIRAAATLYMFPSHADACPLIGMESLCTGAPMVVPSQKDIGFSLYATPVGAPKEEGQGVYTLLNDANAFGYPNHTDTKKAQKTLFNAIEQINNLSKDDQNKMARRISNDSLRKFSWFLTEKTKDGTIKAYGAALAYSDFYQKLTSSSTALPHPTLQFIPTQQKKVIPIPMTKWNIKNTVPRLRALFVAFALYIMYSFITWKNNLKSKFHYAQ